MRQTNDDQLFYDSPGFFGNIFDKLSKRYHSLSSYLPYLAYDKAKKIYENNDGTKGIIFEISPRIVAADPTPFESLMDVLPLGCFMQTMLYGSPNITNMVDRFLNNAANPKPVYQSIAEEYAGFFESRTQSSINALMITKVKNYRLFISVTFSDDYDDVIISDTMMSFKNILSTKKFYPINLEPDGLIGLEFEMFNMNHDYRNIPGWDEKEPINECILAPDSKIEIKDDYFVSDGVYWASLNPVQYPDETHIYEFGKKLGDYLTLNVDKQQFYDPFIITSSVSKYSKGDTSKVRAKGLSITAQDLPGHIFPTHAAKQTDALDAIKKFTAKTPLVKQTLSILVSAKTKTDLERNVSSTISYWSSGDPPARYRLMKNKYIQFLDFLACLPFNMSTDYMKLSKSDKTLFIDEASHFIPAEADWSGTENPTVLTISRRGQLVGFDMFDSASNYNGYIVATSGAGKSVFINLLTLSYLIRDDRVFIFDIGRSYEKLAKTIGGQWIEFNPDNPISINPFSEINTPQDLKEYAEYLIDFLYFIGGPASIAMSEEIQYFVKSHIEQALNELWKNYGNKLEITHFSDWFLSQDDDRLTDFGQQLRPFTSKGRYGAFFSGKSEINFNNKFVVMELDTLENMPQMRDAVMMIMMFHISRSIYLSGIHKDRVLVFMDEAHKFLGTSPNIDIFIEQAYRRFRKHNASILVATQGFDDIYNPKEQRLTRAGRTIFNTSAWKFFLEQNKESINALEQSGLLKLTELELTVLHSIKNYKPFHSEAMIFSPAGLNIPVRIIIDRFMYYLFTTSMEDKVKIKVYTDQGYSIEESIKKIIKDENNS